MEKELPTKSGLTLKGVLNMCTEMYKRSLTQTDDEVRLELEVFHAIQEEAMEKGDYFFITHGGLEKMYERVNGPPDLDINTLTGEITLEDKKYFKYLKNKNKKIND